ncbi:MAG TPA: glycosyltransferase family 39 protein, partial [Promineifilum sp.]|nr:glycosyltransferase family 39 protein [Promineifilum sp.]
MTHHRHRALAVGLLVLYFAAAVHMAFALPALATPNELLNFEYVQVMRQIGGLPNRGLVDSEVRYTEWHQPPLYFAFAALFGLAVPVPPSADNPPPPIAMPANPHYLSTPAGNRNPVVHVNPANTPLLYTSRVAAALLGALGVAALHAAGKRVYGPAAGLLMASLLAFQPTYIHLSGSVNNDMPLTAVVAIVMSYAVLLVERSSRQGREGSKGRKEEISRKDAENAKLRTLSFAFSASLREIFPFFVLGLLCAAAILTKANGVFVLVFPAVVLLGVLVGGRRRTTNDRRPPTADRQPRPTGPLPTAHWLPAAAATAAGLLPLWVGWLWLNAVRMHDALGLSGSLPVGRVLRLGPLDFNHVIPFLPAIWRSYWLDWSAGDVGYGPDWLYALWLMAVVVMLLGWLRPMRLIRNYKLGIRNREESSRKGRQEEISSWRPWLPWRPLRELFLAH